MFEFATIALTISFLLSGIALGLGIAFRSANITNFGKEELLHSVINSAIIGSFALFTTVLLSFGYNCTTSECSIEKVQLRTAECITSLSDVQIFLGRITNLRVKIEHLEYEPFFGLSHVSNSLSSILTWVAIMHSFVAAQVYIIKTWLLSLIDILLSAGILFRMFFPLRRAGNAMIGLAVGLVIGFTLSTEIISLKALQSIEKHTADLKSYSDSLAWVPTIHFGDQGVLESIADRSAHLKEVVSKTLLSSSSLLSVLIFPSFVSVLTGSAMSVLIAYGIYRALSLSVFVPTP